MELAEYRQSGVSGEGGTGKLSLSYGPLWPWGNVSPVGSDLVIFKEKAKIQLFM